MPYQLFVGGYVGSELVSALTNKPSTNKHTNKAGKVSLNDTFIKNSTKYSDGYGLYWHVTVEGKYWRMDGVALKDTALPVVVQHSFCNFPDH